MTPKKFFAALIVRLMIGALAAFVFFNFTLPTQVYAQPASAYIPELNSFIASVSNGEDTLRGVYVPGVIAYPIIQQPEGDSGFVSDQYGVVTEFDMAARAGTVGLLAHNNRAGKNFFNIPLGSKIILVYGNGRTETFIVEQIASYEVLPYGQYRNIDTQETTSVGWLFNKFYSGEYHLTLQTCIQNGDDLSWGRMFIVAKPVAAELPVSLSQ